MRSFRFFILISLCSSILGVFLVFGFPYILNNTYVQQSDPTDLWYLVSYRYEPPHNYTLPANSFREDYFRSYGGGARVVSTAYKGEIDFTVSSGTISLFIFNYNNYMQWKAQEPYVAFLEATDTGTANFTFPIPHSSGIVLPSILVLVNDSPIQKNVIIGGKLWLETPLMQSWFGSNPIQEWVLPGSIFAGFCVIVGGVILAISSIRKKRALRSISENQYRYNNDYCQ